MVRRSQTPGQNVPGSYFPVYRDEIEGDLRIVIDDGNRELIFKGPQLDPDKLRDATRPPSFFDFRKGSMREQNEAYREARRAWEETEYTPEQIDQMTGFFEDPDNGYLRIGVPAAVLSLGAAEKLGMPKGYRVTTTLEEVMNDPALYEQYPALRNIRIQDTPLFDWATNGSYNPETKTISLGSFKISEESGRQGLAGTLVHEIQHAIQHIEGQSGGANTAMFETPEYRKLEETVEIQRANLANATKQVVKGILGKNLLQGKLSGEQSFIKGFLGRQKPQKFSDLPEETQTEVLRGFKNYLHSKVQHDDEYNRKLHKGLSYEDAVASGQNLYAGYRERKEFIDLVGPDIVRALDANDKGLLRTAGFLKKTEDRLARASSANYQLYLSNPGETNARLASLYQTGIKKGKHYFVSSGDISPELAERFKTLFPESVDLRYSNFGPVAGEKELQTMEVLKHIPGSQLMQVGSPNVLREMVKGDLPTDRSQINDPRIPNYPYRSQGAPDEKRLNYLTQRLAYVRGSLEQDTLMHPVTRRKLQNEMRSIMAELRDYSPSSSASEPPSKIRAYHGSQADFDEFSSDYIGTGEGTQLKGFGHYLAENEDVARIYYDKSAKFPAATDKDSLARNLVDDYYYGDFESLEDAMLEQGSRVMKQAFQDKILYKFDDNSGIELDFKKWDETGNLDSSLRPIDLSSGAHMYQVDIDVKPEELLDWDKPLSEQSEKIQKIFPAENYPETYRGSSLYDQLAGSALMSGSRAFDPATGGRASAPQASKHLNSLGIKGIRYKDGFSRGKEGGTSNYVIFDGRLITISKKYGVAIPIAAAMLAKETGQDPTSFYSEDNLVQQKARGGPVGGLGVYFSKMQMQGA
jgi:hypothetical protein